MAYDEQLPGRIRRALRARTDITERKMFGGLAFLRDGRMCCGIVGGDLMVRVVDTEIAAALDLPHVRPMDFTGRPLRGFVYVSPPALTTARELRRWIERGLEFTASKSSTPPRRNGRRTRS